MASRHATRSPTTSWWRCSSARASTSRSIRRTGRTGWRRCTGAGRRSRRPTSCRRCRSGGDRCWRPATVREGIGAACLLRVVSPGHRPDPGSPGHRQTRATRSSSTSPPAACASGPASRTDSASSIARPLVEKVVAELRRGLQQLAVPVVPLPGVARRRVQRVRLQLLQVAVSGADAAHRGGGPAQAAPADRDRPDIELDGWVVQRRCPHRNADLSVFGEVRECELVCTLHGWRFDLETGRCLTSAGTSSAGAPTDRAEAAARKQLLSWRRGPRPGCASA